VIDIKSDVINREKEDGFQWQLEAQQQYILDFPTHVTLRWWAIPGEETRSVEDARPNTD
jgi:hypothetical protein